MTGNTPARIQGPHQAIPLADQQQRFIAELFDILWDRYRDRVAYVQTYEQVVARTGARFVNDHIAFRTFACQRPAAGIASLSRLFESLGYRAAGCYFFPEKHLSAIHFQHANGDFPKLFISELQVWKLSPAARKIILGAIASHRPPVADETLAEMADIGQVSASRRQQLLAEVVAQFHQLPWTVPEKNDVAAINRESQYAAWVLVHGYNVNHFTTLINSQGAPELADIELTIAALKQAGIPMKAEIEGARGSKLRQSSTEAVMIDVDVRDGGQPATMPWTYAYFELAERGEIADPETGHRGWFEGFLGPQATQLFEMTKVR